MKSFLLRRVFPRFAPAALLALLPLSSLRAAFDPAIVAADSQWVFHADLNALRASIMGRELVAETEKLKVTTGDAKVGVDFEKLMETIGSVTGYGANFTNDPAAVDGTLIVRGTADLKKIAEGALVQATITSPANVTEITGLPFPAYAVTSGDAAASRPAVKSAPATQVIVAFPPEAVVLVSKSRAQLLKAREVIRGNAPSLAKNPASVLRGLLAPGNNATLFAASVVPSGDFLPVDGPQARILQMASAGSLALGETGGLTFAHLELVASSGAMAEKLMKILQGMTAMLSLAETSDKQLSEFLNSAAVTRDNDRVTLRLSYDSARLVQMLRTFRDQQLVSRPRPQPPRANIGKVVAEWKSSDVPAESVIGTEGFSWKTIENVSLASNATVVLTASRSGGNKVARVDRVEILPAAGAGTPLVFRGEYMRLSGWAIENKQAAAAGGKAIVARSPTSIARFQFPGAAGTYSLKVAYAGEPGDAASFTVGIKDLEDAASPSNPPKAP